ncbi:hypothetical protein GCM10027048_38120 [Hymenobacter coalescens]
MQPEDIDKLFRAKLEQHATPPPPSLWYDLQEQLEPEEKKRRGGFWMFAVAAAVTLLLLAGGGWLLRQSQRPGTTDGTLASRPAPAARPDAGAALPSATAPATSGNGTAPKADFGTESATAAAETGSLATGPATSANSVETSKKLATTQATDAARPASTHQQQQLLARNPERAAAPRESARPEAPDFRRADEPALERQALAVQPVPAPATTPAAAVSPAPAGVISLPTMGAIEVEVRQHPEQAVALAAAATEETPGRTRPSVRGVLRQVRRLAQGEKPDLTEVGLPANPALTVQARVAGHTLTKTIAL